MTDREPIDLSKVPSQIGSYRVLEILGSGGQGTVYRGRHFQEGWARAQGGDVAIKVVRDRADDPRFKKRFVNECTRLKMLPAHPNIVETLELEDSKGMLGLVMTLVEGATLEERIRSGQSLGEVMVLLYALARAVDHIHEFNIVHRDLKPGNVVLSADGSPVLLDFGIAKDLTTTSQDTADGYVIGTQDWMSPEQLSGKAVTAASDRYALGLLAYHLFSEGKFPWEERSLSVEARFRQELIPCHEVSARVNSELSDVIMKMLSFRPEDRYPSAHRFVEALLGPVQELCREAQSSATKVKAQRAAKKDLQRIEALSSAKPKPKPRSQPEPAPQLQEHQAVPRPRSESPAPVPREPLPAIDTDVLLASKFQEDKPEPRPVLQDIRIFYEVKCQRKWWLLGPVIDVQVLLRVEPSAQEIPTWLPSLLVVRKRRHVPTKVDDGETVMKVTQLRLTDGQGQIVIDPMWWGRDYLIKLFFESASERSNFRLIGKKADNIRLG
jgi:serine/threonine protein kinase